MTRPAPDIPRAPESAPGGPQECPEGGFAAPAMREGQNGPQTGAGSLGGGQAPRGPIHWARRQQAEREARQAARHENDLRKLIAGAIRDTPARYPDDIADAVWRVIQPHLDPELRRQLDDAITALGKSEAELAQLRAQHAGPTVREAADNDRRWWADKYAREGK